MAKQSNVIWGTPDNPQKVLVDVRHEFNEDGPDRHTGLLFPNGFIVIDAGGPVIMQGQYVKEVEGVGLYEIDFDSSAEYSGSLGDLIAAV